MQYLIIHKDLPLTVADFSEDGRLIQYSHNYKNADYLPLHAPKDMNWLINWWNERAVPVKQGKVHEMLIQQGIYCSEEYLLRNLGLSLTDCYWIKPVDSTLMWKDVNFYQNMFHNEMVIEKAAGVCGKQLNLSPNSSLQGQLEKKWIISNDTRYLVKGNHGIFSTESINETLACRFHELQGYSSFAPYKLVHIAERDYDWGCISPAFTSEHLELVSAQAVVESSKKPNDVSMYEHFINVCGQHGMDTVELRKNLEYQILSDFVLNNTDRHLNNIGILRDTESLRFIRMAPIFDTGKSLFVDTAVPLEKKDILRIPINSFSKSQIKLLDYVTDRALVDAARIMPPETIKKAYSYDSKMDDTTISRVCEGYEKKIELFRAYQLGHSLEKIVVPVRHQSIVPDDVFEL